MRSDAPIIHDSSLARGAFETMQREDRCREAYELPSGLSIFTAHNYSAPSLFERSLDYLGVRGYRVLNRRVPVWSNSLRVAWFLEYLETECVTPLVLYCDADDVILRDDPRRVVELFVEHACEALYCSTRWPHGYQCVPEIRCWADSVHKGRYLNGGVFIGRREFLIEVYREVMQYVTPQDMEDNADSHRFYRSELSFRDGFPRGVGCDQAILRFLEPRFYPRLKIDTAGLLVWRNDSRTLLQKTMRTAKSWLPLSVRVWLRALRGRGGRTQGRSSP